MINDKICLKFPELFFLVRWVKIRFKKGGNDFLVLGIERSLILQILVETVSLVSNFKLIQAMEVWFVLLFSSVFKTKSATNVYFTVVVFSSKKWPNFVHCEIETNAVQNHIDEFVTDFRSQIFPIFWKQQSQVVLQLFGGCFCFSLF